MKQEYLAWNLDINDALTTSLTSQVIVIALGIATICFICNVAYNYLSTGFAKLTGDKGGSFPDYQEIARCIVLIICISSYLPIAKTIVGTIETINKATSSGRMENVKSFKAFQEAQGMPDPNATIIEKQPDGTVSTSFVNQAKQMINTVKNVVVEETEQLSKLGRDIGNMATMLLPQNFAVVLFHVIVLLLVFIIKIVVQGVVVILTKVLVIVGPLAFAFSVLPCFKKQLEQWFSTLVTTGMTLTTINILDSIIDSATGHLMGDMNMVSSVDVISNVDNRIELIALDCVVIVLYCSCFWLTSKFVGKGDAGRVLSKLVSTATTLAAVAVTGGGSAAGASGGGEGMKAAANISKNVIEGD